MINFEQFCSESQSGTFVFARVGLEHTVTHPDHPRALLGDFWIVRYDDDGVALGIEIFQDTHHRFATFRIEITGGFVGQNKVSLSGAKP